MGAGVQTARPFLRNDFIAEYTGELVDSSKAIKKRRKKYNCNVNKTGKIPSYEFEFYFKGKKYWYVFKLFSNSMCILVICVFPEVFLIFFPCHLYRNRIDSDRDTGRLGRLINHDSGPNVNVKPMVFEVAGKPRLLFVAKRDIEKGEQLFYTYGETDPAILKANPWLKPSMICSLNLLFEMCTFHACCVLSPQFNSYINLYMFIPWGQRYDLRIRLYRLVNIYC